MSEQTQNPQPVSEQNNPTTVKNNARQIFGVLLIILSLTLIALGIYQAATQQAYELIGLGVVALCILYMASSPKPEPTLSPVSSSEKNNTESLLKQQVVLLTSLNDRILISDQAKRIAFREKDRDALREAIVDDIRQEDYAAANALADDMAEVYGYREEAEQFRTQIHEAEEKRRNEIISNAISQIEEIIAKYNWERAHHEVNRLMRLYPDHPRVNNLHAQIDQAKEAHKHDLERQFLEAAENDQLEKAMELLKELDKYLTPQEAKPYVEVARGVIGKKKENLGVRFKLAVQDRDWIRALKIGENIIRDFPNSLFANEVRSMMDLLRDRAAKQHDAAQTPSQEQVATDS